MREGNVTADGGNAETISVEGDAADDSVEDAAIFCGVGVIFSGIG